MSKNIYCAESTNGDPRILDVSASNEKTTPAKRVDIVSIKMIKEASLLYVGRKIGSPKDAYVLIKGIIESADREQLVVCSLNTKNQPTTINIVSIGTLNSSLVHPRELFKAAILSNAAGIIIAHNHPSGDPEPSSEDINITKRIKEAGKLLGIDLIDHIIVGNSTFISLKEKGIL